MQQDSYTIRVDPENPAAWDPLGLSWPIIATPLVAIALIAAALFWVKRRKPRPRP